MITEEAEVDLMHALVEPGIPSLFEPLNFE